MRFLNVSSRFFSFLSQGSADNPQEAFRTEAPAAQTPSEYLALALEYAELATCQTLYEHQTNRLALLLDFAYRDDSFALLTHQIDARLFELDHSPQTLAHQKDQIAIINEFILNDMDCPVVSGIVTRGSFLTASERATEPILTKPDSRDDLRAANFKIHQSRVKTLATLTSKTARIGVLSGVASLFIGSVAYVSNFSTVANSSITTISEKILAISGGAKTSAKASHKDKKPLSELNDIALLFKYEKWMDRQALNRENQSVAQEELERAKRKNNPIEIQQWSKRSETHFDEVNTATRHIDLVQNELNQRRLVPHEPYLFTRC